MTTDSWWPSVLTNRNLDELLEGASWRARGLHGGSGRSRCLTLQKLGGWGAHQALLWHRTDAVRARGCWGASGCLAGYHPQGTAGGQPRYPPAPKCPSTRASQTPGTGDSTIPRTCAPGTDAAGAEPCPGSCCGASFLGA